MGKFYISFDNVLYLYSINVVHEITIFFNENETHAFNVIFLVGFFLACT